MATKKTGTPSKRSTKDQKPAPKGKGQMSDKDLDKVSGGRAYTRLSGEGCKETGDTGMMGCSG